jgi:two-component system LytT family response regulator
VKVLLVDDETPARTRLRRLLEKHPHINIVGEASNGIAALEEIEKLKPDVVFLDIEMPELDGLGVAEAIKLDGPAVVFVTAYDEHALKAFEVAAADYLVKPINEARLTTSLAKVRKRIARPITAKSPDYSDLLATLAGQAPARRLAVKCGAKFVVFETAKISAIIARDHYAAIIVDGRELLADDPLDVLVERLNPKQFIRIHRSTVINVEFLKELEREGDRKYVAVLTDIGKTRVPVSRERLPELKGILGL